MTETGTPAVPVTSKNAKKSAGAQARYAAIQRLIKNHNDEFHTLYAEEAEKRGVKTRAATKAQKIARLKEQLKELETS